MSLIVRSYTRGHKFRLIKDHCNLNCRLNFFVCRSLNVWNHFPSHVVERDSTAIFKSILSSLKLGSSYFFKFLFYFKECLPHDAMLARYICCHRVSVRPSQVGVLPKWLNLGYANNAVR